MAEDVRVWVEDPSSVAVLGAYVGLHDSVSKAKLQSGYSDATGVVTFPAVDTALNGGVYEIRIAPPAPGSVSNGSVQNITVADGGNNNFDVEVSFVGLDTATEPWLCRCSGHVTNAHGEAIVGAVVEFSEGCIPQLAILSSGDYDVKGILPIRKQVLADSAGKLTVDLVRGADYRVLVEGFWSVPRTVRVPDAASVNLVDVLFPYAKTLEWYDEGSQLLPTAAPTLALAVGASKVLTINVLARSGIVLDYGEVTLSSSDEEILGISSGTSGSVTLTAVAAGSATVTVKRTVVEDLGITAVTDPGIVGTLSVTIA